MSGDTQALGLLLSEAVDASDGARIDRIAEEAGVALRRYTRVEGPKDLACIHAAFFSRDLYEGSSLRKPGPRSDAFFRMADAAPNLRWLHVCTSGLDLPQYANALARGVTVTRSSGVTAQPIAQTVLAAVMAQLRGFTYWLAAQARKEWSPLTGADRPREIAGQRVLVIGAGPIGCEIARLLKAVGFRVEAVRRSSQAAAPFDRTWHSAELDDALPQCDWLILAAPLTEETRGMMDRRRLALLPSHARVINVARGELLDETALAEALAAGRLGGAYLDTFSQEPLPSDSPLWTLPGVWISPHNCAASQGHEGRGMAVFLDRLRDWLREAGGQSPRNS